MFGRLAMGFANVRAGTRVLMLVLVQAGVASQGQQDVQTLRVVRRKAWKAMNSQQYSLAARLFGELEELQLQLNPNVRPWLFCVPPWHCKEKS